MRHGIDLAIRAEQGRLQEHAALQTLGVAHGSHIHIQPRARFLEGRNIGRHYDNGHVFGGERRGGNGEAEALQHIGNRLEGLHRIFVAVAREANDEAVAGQLVVAHAGNDGDVLDARATREGVGTESEQESRE